MFIDIIYSYLSAFFVALLDHVVFFFCTLTEIRAKIVATVSDKTLPPPIYIPGKKVNRLQFIYHDRLNQKIQSLILKKES